MKSTETCDIIGSNVFDKSNNKAARPIHLVGLYLCIFMFIIIMVVTIKLAVMDGYMYIDVFGDSINKSILSGIIVQIQVILSVFMTL